MKFLIVISFLISCIFASLESDELLKIGNELIELDDHHKNVILVLGNTGSGKSTLLKWIAGDDTKLKSVETGEGTGHFLVEDGNERIGSSANSKAIYPELVMNNKTNTAFYDCPGFSDTRNASQNIANTFFMKKLTDFADGVKIIFVVSEKSVKKGGDPIDFMKMMRHASGLIKDFNKFRNSIAVVVTKVTNVKKEGVLVSDEKIIEQIANYFHEVSDDMESKLKDLNNSETDNILYRKSIDLLKILQTKEGEKYERIGIFRRPNEPGLFSDIEFYKKEKKSIEEILNNDLVYEKKSNDDFVY